jgi:hypothetical protein
MEKETLPMASNKDFVVKQATKLAQTNKPAPVYKPSVPYQIKQAGTGTYNTVKNTGSKKN